MAVTPVSPGLLKGVRVLDLTQFEAGTRPAGLCRPRRDRHRPCGVGTAMAAILTSDMPLDVPPPRDSRFGSPLVLSRVQ